MDVTDCPSDSAHLSSSVKGICLEQILVGQLQDAVELPHRVLGGLERPCPSPESADGDASTYATSTSYAGKSAASNTFYDCYCQEVGRLLKNFAKLFLWLLSFLTH